MRPAAGDLLDTASGESADGLRGPFDGTPKVAALAQHAVAAIAPDVRQLVRWSRGRAMSWMECVSKDERGSERLKVIKDEKKSVIGKIPEVQRVW